jgi:hypothetical protein
MKITVKVDEQGKVIASADEAGSEGFLPTVFEVSDEEMNQYLQGEKEARVEEGKLVFTLAEEKSEGVESDNPFSLHIENMWS